MKKTKTLTYCAIVLLLSTRTFAGAEEIIAENLPEVKQPTSGELLQKELEMRQQNKLRNEKEVKVKNRIKYLELMKSLFEKEKEIEKSMGKKLSKKFYNDDGKHLSKTGIYLTAIFFINNELQALISFENKKTFLSKGDKINKWKVESIFQKYIVVKKKGQTEKVGFFINELN